MVFPNPPSHSRWQVIDELEPGKFRVHCTCGSGVDKALARRYVAGESLSCGCLRRKKEREQGKRNLSLLRAGYKEWLQEHPPQPMKYAPKLPALGELVEVPQTLTSLKALNLTLKYRSFSRRTDALFLVALANLVSPATLFWALLQKSDESQNSIA